MIWLLVNLLVFSILLYYYASKKYSYWSDRGVPGPKQIFPFGYTLTRAFSDPEKLELGWMKKYGKVYGLYTGLLPTLTIADSELIKQVMVKDFHLFPNRRVINSYHEHWNKNLFVADDEDWKRLRSITTPAFTSGKLRSMIPLMKECMVKFVKYLNGQVANNDGVIETKQVVAGFTIDVISSAAFGTETGANDDRTKRNPFVHHGLRVFTFNPLKYAATLCLPRQVLDFLGIKSVHHRDSFAFLVNLSKSVVQQRKENKEVKRNDLVQLMIDAFAYEDELDETGYDKLAVSMDVNDDETAEVSKSNNSTRVKKYLTESEIIAQCFLFFVAGFETTSSAITHAIYELSKNDALQEKLLEAIHEKMDGIDPSDTDSYYDQLLNHVPYLDAVVKESLRMYPPFVRLERRVSADGVKLGGIPLDKGTLIEIANYAVHHNPEYYPDPERFNPDRFMPENKDQLVPYTYIPFGAGPRNCVGMRFAYQEAKLCIASLVMRYRLEITPKTPSKLAFSKGSPFMSTQHFQVRICRRK